MLVVEVIVPLGLQGVLSYRVPEPLSAGLKPGVRVRVPVGKSRNYVGVVLCVKNEAEPTNEPYQLKEVLEVLDQTPVVNEIQLRLWRWLSDYYMSPVGDAYRAAMPLMLKEPERYQERTRTVVLLQKPEGEVDDAYWQEKVDSLRKAPRQQDLLLRLMDLTEMGTRPVLREVLTGETGTAALRELQKKGLACVQEEAVSRLQERVAVQAPFALSEAQQFAYTQIKQYWCKKQVVYLHGVTSSGKTEIYTQLLLDCLDSGKSCLYLVPEIALTTQLTHRLQRVLGDRLLVYHSRFSDAERYEIYQELLQRKEPYVLLGARSAVLLPVRDLGLVIVDEEHEKSYQQEDPAPRYQGRNTAIRLAQLTGAKVLLGSATPSVEMYYQARQGEFGLVELKTRYRDVKLPLLKVVDMREAYRRKEFTGHISDALRDDIARVLAAGKQVILFQNRRGFSPFIQCHDCGWVARCPNCDVSLTVHRRQQQLTCHYCGYTIPVPGSCPDCGSGKIKGIGLGTERVEDEVAQLFPQARLERMDLDTTRGRDAYKKIIDRFSSHEVDILIGTQMVTKGLDFEHVQLVGVVNADSLLTMPDYRANERAYQLLEQVSGRAGRSGERGLVVIQTSQPQHRVIGLLARHDFCQLYEEEIEERKAVNYPPFCHFLRVVMRHREVRVLEQAGMLLQQNLQRSFGNRSSMVITPALSRLQDYHIRHLVLRIERGADLGQAKHLLQQHLDWLQSQEDFKALRMYVTME